MHLTTTDYVVTMTMMVIPLAIGFFYAWKDSKKNNRDEYLLGGRKMGVLPVALSLLVTYQSALSLLGFTSDLYQYGPMVMGFYVGNCLSTITGYVIMVPLMHPLQLTSAYDYLEMRYQSKALRTFSTLVGMLQTFFYMVTALVTPGLALQAAAGIPFWVSVAVIGSIGTFYTAFGGIKSVIWTDAFQAFIIVTGLLILIIRGIIVVGSVDKVWSIAEQGGRTSMATVSPDPRTRHSWWGMVIGGAFIWQSNVYNQSTIQRVSSIKSLKSAKLAYLLNVPCFLVYGLLLATVGIVTYSYFYDARCDPLEGGLISNMNQVSLCFMLLVFQDLHGLPGFYMATIFSGALSTLSSGINALSANTVEDVLGGCLKGVSERTIIVIAKVLVFVYGFAILGVAFLAKSLQGPVSQMSTTVVGSFGSVVACIFLMGSTVPRVNKYGAFVGGLLTLALNVWIGVGALLHGRRSTPLQSPPTDQCQYILHPETSFNSSSVTSSPNMTSSHITTTTISGVTEEDNPDGYGFFLYDISYEWFGFIGIVFGSICILVVSIFTSGMANKRTESRLIAPTLRKFWRIEKVTASNETPLEWSHLDASHYSG